MVGRCRIPGRSPLLPRITAIDRAVACGQSVLLSRETCTHADPIGKARREVRVSVQESAEATVPRETSFIGKGRTSQRGRHSRSSEDWR
jgi:hypothetical protein